MRVDIDRIEMSAVRGLLHQGCSSVYLALTPMLHLPWLTRRVSSRAGRRLHGIGIRGRYLFAGPLA